MKNYIPGNVYTSVDGLKFKIVDYGSKPRKSIIQFEESGYIDEVQNETIRKGTVKDYTRPCVCEVGIAYRGARSHPLYHRWVSMIGRCYDTNSSQYKYYGEKGVHVSEEWKVFANYVRDLEQKENYQKMLNEPKNWQVDKDILSKDTKIYSNETTVIINKKENVLERIERCGTPNQRKQVEQYNLKGNLINTFESVAQASKLTNTNMMSISKCCNGKQTHTRNGYVWKFKNN